MKALHLTSRRIIIFAAAMMLVIMPTYADAYRDALWRYLQNGASMSPQQFQGQLRSVVEKNYPNNQDKALKVLTLYGTTQLQEDLLDIYEPAFRKHVSQQELDLLNEVATYPDYDQLVNRIADALTNFQNSPEYAEFAEMLTVAVDDIANGRKPKDVTIPASIPEDYIAAFRTFYTESKSDQIVTSSFSSARQTLSDLFRSANLPDVESLVNRIMDYMAVNMFAVMTRVFYNVATKDDLLFLTTLAQSPAQQHAKDAEIEILAYNQVLVASKLINKMCTWMDKHAPELAAPFHNVAKAVSEAAYPYEGEVRVIVDKQPEFKGGTAEMYKYITQNVVFPEQMSNADIKGRAVFQLIVNRDGSVSDVELMRSTGDEALDAEAKRVIEAMPKWNPAEFQGDFVRCKFTLPVNFKIAAPAPPAEPQEPVNQLAGQTEDEPVFIEVEQMPEFPGGQQALARFLAETVKYPVVARENGIQGRVQLQFIVNKDGSISDVEVVRSGGDPSLDREALRVIRSMPRWKPGLQQGKPVRCKYTVPVTFSLK